MNINHDKYERQDLIAAYVKKISEVQEKLATNFNILTDEIKNVLPIKDTELAQESDRNISKYHTYLSKTFDEKRKLASLRGKKDEIDGELNDYYRFNWDKSTKLSETAIGKYVMSHPVYMAINNLVKDQEAVVSYLDGVVTGFRDRGFAIKNMIEMRKIEMGMN
jgi:hypothetical protein